MADPKKQAETQLRNIEKATGMTVAQFVDAVQKAGLLKHGKILAFIKSEFGMTYGNANLMSHVVREKMAGGPPSAASLLDAQYSGKKAGLRPIYEVLSSFAENLGGDVSKVIQKTGVSFRRKKQFALVQVPSSKRVQLGLNLSNTPNDERIKETKGMCSHRVDVTSLDGVDDTLRSWIRLAYEGAG